MEYVLLYFLFFILGICVGNLIQIYFQPERK